MSEPIKIWIRNEAPELAQALRKELEELGVTEIQFAGAEHEADLVAVPIAMPYQAGRAAETPRGDAFQWAVAPATHESELGVVLAQWRDGVWDDVLLQPLRQVDVLTKLEALRTRRLWDEVKDLNQGFGELMDRLREDLSLAERLQKARLPKRFSPIRGLEIHSRYFAGGRAGGDFFDVAEGAGAASPVSIVLTDASSYGLSSAVVASLLRVSARVSTTTPRTTVAALCEELGSVLSQAQQLSVLYAVLERETLRLRCLNVGHGALWLWRAGRLTQLTDQAQAPLTQGTRADTLGAEQSWQLEPGDRLIACSDGLSEAVGGLAPAWLKRQIEDVPVSTPIDLLNEIAFEIKQRFGGEAGGFPPQDTSALVVEIDARALRLATRAPGAPKNEA